jgi:hypothetical protein
VKGDHKGVKMIKNITICFRTNDDLRKALAKISEQERRSLSSMIENILLEYLEEGKALKRTKEEKRRFPRRPLEAPALIRGLTPDSKDVSAGIVLNMSIGGLQISIPSSYQYEIRGDQESATFSVVFTLPEGRRPLTVQCAPLHATSINGETNIGASFCDSDFTSYQAIQNYLIN